MKSSFVACAAVLGALAAAPPLHAQSLPAPDIDCEALPGPKLFVEAGDTQMTLLADLARDLRDADPPLTLIYVPASTCTLVENVFDDVPWAVQGTPFRYAPSRREVPDAEWNRAAPRQCNFPEGGQPIDLGIGATFISSCAQSVLDKQPDDVEVFNGPAQAYGFVVPEGELEAADFGITREEAYYVFSGQGQAQDVVPWVFEPNPESGTPSVYIRRATTSTLLTMAGNVAPDILPASMWVGYRLEGQEDRSSVVINGVANAPASTRSGTIGILGIDLYDQRRGDLDMLAYKARGQSYGFFPDSTATRRDKRNVRDGHYVPWGYTQYLYRVDDDGVPVNDNVQRILDLISSETEVRLVGQPDLPSDQRYDRDGIDILKRNGLVPECAMKVTRSIEGGPLSVFEPEHPCHCYYESVEDPGIEDDVRFTNRCVACERDRDCQSGVCSRGFCEER